MEREQAEHLYNWWHTEIKPRLNRRTECNLITYTPVDKACYDLNVIIYTRNKRGYELSVYTSDFDVASEFMCAVFKHCEAQESYQQGHQSTLIECIDN